MHFCQTIRPITKFGTLTKNKGQMHFCQTIRPITKFGTLTSYWKKKYHEPEIDRFKRGRN